MTMPKKMSVHLPPKPRQSETTTSSLLPLNHNFTTQSSLHPCLGTYSFSSYIHPGTPSPQSHDIAMLPSLTPSRPRAPPPAAHHPLYPPHQQIRSHTPTYTTSTPSLPPLATPARSSPSASSPQGPRNLHTQASRFDAAKHHPVFATRYPWQRETPAGFAEAVRGCAGGGGGGGVKGVDGKNPVAVGWVQRDKGSGTRSWSDDMRGGGRAKL